MIHLNALTRNKHALLHPSTSTSFVISLVGGTTKPPNSQPHEPLRLHGKPLGDSKKEGPGLWRIASAGRSWRMLWLKDPFFVLLPQDFGNDGSIPSFQDVSSFDMLWLFSCSGFMVGLAFNNWHLQTCFYSQQNAGGYGHACGKIFCPGNLIGLWVNVWPLWLVNMAYPS